jgi:hypothetical protein
VSEKLSLELETGRVCRVEREELEEMLGLEELKNQMAQEHITKLSRMFEVLVNQEDRGLISQIEDKDEIIMLN